MKRFVVLGLVMAVAFAARAQDDDEERGGFKKENLFTGGSISLSFGNNSFLVGVNPVFGYKLAEWVDAGLVINYQYSSFRDYYNIDDRLRQSLYGGGVFTRLFPIDFLFAQAQVEHNFITQKYIQPPNGGPTEKYTVEANSVLVGAGYAQGRMRGFNSGYFYLSILFDITNNPNSPYTNVYGRPVPVFRAGLNIPLFQGRGRY